MNMTLRDDERNHVLSVAVSYQLTVRPTASCTIARMTGKGTQVVGKHHARIARLFAAAPELYSVARLVARESPECKVRGLCTVRGAADFWWKG
jgi:hypothetical protein